MPEDIILYVAIARCVSALNQPGGEEKKGFEREGEKNAKKCNLHSNLFTKQPYTLTNDKINDGPCCFCAPPVRFL